MRLSKDISDNNIPDPVLIHTYNEVIQFIKVIRNLLKDSYNELDDKHDLMSVFADQKTFEKISEIEWEYALKNISEITSSDNKWDPVLDGEFLDYYKVPRCVDRFLLQIKSFSERVDCFRQIDCKFQLIDIQCDLFDRFLNFLRKSSEASGINIFFFTEEPDINLSRILNGVNFLRLILQEKALIEPDLRPKLDRSIMSKLEKITDDYVTYRNRLIERVELNPSPR